MLLELRIRDFAVIRDLSVEVGAGLNVLTGETGAGKSILIGALSLLLGERASSESVRAGQDRAVVEAVFDLAGRDRITARLEALGLPTDGDLLVLRREVQAEGRNRAWINGSPVTAGQVGEFGKALADLHGQHEHQTLLHGHEQRAILDAFAGAGDAADAVAQHHADLQETREERARRQERARDLEKRSDFLRFQLDELRKADVREDEEEELEAELNRLDHAEELVRGTSGAHEALYAGDDSVSERLAGVRDLLRRLKAADPRLAEMADPLEDAYHQVTEAGRSLGDYAAGVEMDPGRAEELRSRAALLSRLKRKYGPELADVVANRERMEGELAELEGGEIALDELARREAREEENLREAAERLTGAREEAAQRLATEVQALLPELGMADGVFRVHLEPLDSPGAHGAESVTFRASLNPGFEPRALSRIASGGELSRVMLALKTILAAVDRIPTLVFDEIDAGIGGKVANAVAHKLLEVSAHHQVLVITHLPQLAARAHRHLRVEKGTTEGMATAGIIALQGEPRVREIARMLGGDPESETSREHARELLAPEELSPAAGAEAGAGSGSGPARPDHSR